MKRLALAPIAVIIATLVFATVILAQSSANFDISWHGMSGGGQRASSSFALQDALGQNVIGSSQSANFVVQAGFVAGLDGSTQANATATPTATPLPTPQAGGDAFEDDDVCARSKTLATTGATQTHTFHDAGDTDWVRFTAEAGKTYVIRVENVSDQSDAVINLFDVCNNTQSGSGQNSFGNEVVLNWNATKNGDYFLQILQFDGTVFGNDVNYDLSITVDGVPPAAPQNPRCIAVDATTIGVQWKKSPEFDVNRYRVKYNRPDNSESGIIDVSGADTTFTQVSGLTTGQVYNVTVRALDFSDNQSAASGTLDCTPNTPVDTTPPVVTLQAPVGSPTISTTNNSLTFSGLATDAGNNLSRVKVTNQTLNVNGWDYSLTGGSDSFRIENLAMAIGDNTIKIEAFDDKGNKGEKTVTVKRLGQAKGAVIIIAGRNDTNGLQTNIYNITNRAYRIFQSGGFKEDDIFYISPVQQDADNDGVADDVDATPANPTAVENALKTWANGKVGPDKPLFVYFADHGFVDKFCLDGCATGNSITPKQVNEWISALETSTGVDQVNIVIEACLSGSFISRVNPADLNTLSKPGRVVITSTSDDKNAYASAEGAYFSDAFFSCIADSQDLRTCFDQAKVAVTTTGVNQSPQMDDNGDAVYNNGDGSVAHTRFVTRFFASVRPQISSAGTVQSSGATRTLFAEVEEGAEKISLVWAAVYPPSFSEPVETTLNLNVPTVKLEDLDGDGRYEFNYVNGFTEPETAVNKYRIVFYAQDKNDINAVPKGDLGGGTLKVFLPVISR
ncbi:MAG: C13 family peptidase [Caldilineaceae bacterium]